MVTQGQRAFIENAANAFVIMPITLRIWRGKTTLKRAAEKAAQLAGVDGKAQDSTRITVNGLGDAHEDLKVVISAHDKIRDYVYANTLPFTLAEEGEHKRGDRLVFVGALPQVLSDLQELEAKACAILEAFKTDYVDRYNAAINSMGDWGGELKDRLPTADEISGKYGVRIGNPQPVPVMDMERYGSIPAALANEIAERNAETLRKQLATAQDQAIKKTIAQMERIQTVLGKEGSQLYDTLLNDTKHWGEMLKQVTEGFDRDQNIIAQADLILEKVANVESKEEWRNSDTKRSEAVRAATSAVKVLKKVRSAETRTHSPEQGEIINGGMIADLI
mgnify:CR=1 FL=1|tara:strand:+ start:968 stop:1969 length:1002 start_codon:yes stop_codon:yes gene_type:complete